MDGWMDGHPANMHPRDPLLSHHDFSSSVSFSFSGFESRQSSHVLMASYPYSPLENRYTFCPHSLRNTGERRQRGRADDADVGGWCFLKVKPSAFQMSCAPASCALTERRASTGWRSCRASGGNCSAERRSRPIRAKYISPEGLVFHTSSHISVTWVISQAIAKRNTFASSNRKLTNPISPTHLILWSLWWKHHRE